MVLCCESFYNIKICYLISLNLVCYYGNICTLPYCLLLSGNKDMNTGAFAHQNRSDCSNTDKMRIKKSRKGNKKSVYLVKRKIILKVSGQKRALQVYIT